MSEHSKIVSLGDVVIERSERVDDPSSTGISRFIGLEHFDSGRLSINRFGTTDDLESAMKICRAGDTLLARRNVYLKRASMTEFDAICSGDAIVLHETPDLVPGFLPIILNSTDFWDYANENADGSMSKRLSVKHLKGYQFHLPSKDEQLRVVNLVWKLERLDSSLSSMLSDLDLCIKSRFIEMFGDPSNNTKWESKQLKEITSKIGSGATPKGGKSSYVGTDIAFIRSMNVHDGSFLYDDLAYITEEQADKLANVTVEPKDILFNITGASVARCCIVPDDVLPARVNQHVSIIRLDKNVMNPIFFNTLIVSNSVKRTLLNDSKSNGATREAITKEMLSSLEVIIPPIELQNRFAGFVRQVDKSKFMLKKHIEDTKSLQQAIINKCFEANDDV